MARQFVSAMVIINKWEYETDRHGDQGYQSNFFLSLHYLLHSFDQNPEVCMCIKMFNICAIYNSAKLKSLVLWVSWG